jgi:hypothetical protein
MLTISCRRYRRVQRMKPGRMTPQPCPPHMEMNAPVPARRRLPRVDFRSTKGKKIRRKQTETRRREKDIQTSPMISCFLKFRVFVFSSLHKTIRAFNLMSWRATCKPIPSDTSFFSRQNCDSTALAGTFGVIAAARRENLGGCLDRFFLMITIFSKKNRQIPL